VIDKKYDLPGSVCLLGFGNPSGVLWEVLDFAQSDPAIRDVSGSLWEPGRSKRTFGNRSISMGSAFFTGEPGNHQGDQYCSYN
jgi:hypothetical protein